MSISIVQNTLSDVASISAGVVDRYDSNAGWLILRGIEAGPGISIDVVDADNDVFITNQKKIVISSTGGGPGPGGSISGAINVGTGIGVSDGVSGSSIRLKSFVAGNNIQLTTVGDDIVVSANNVIVGAENVGTGEELYKGINNNNLQFRTIRGDQNITVSINGDDLVISAP
ncbi:MAG: hypothetical protein WC284_16825, partial [Candidimonas sp.]